MSHLRFYTTMVQKTRGGLTRTLFWTSAGLATTVVLDTSFALHPPDARVHHRRVVRHDEQQL